MRRRKKKQGAPTKLTEETRKKILDGLRAALPYSHAAALAEITDRTLRDWREQGRKKPSSVYGTFLRQMGLARAAGLARLGATAYVGAVGDPTKGTPSDPRLCLEILARRDPRKWGARKQVELGNVKGQAFKTEAVAEDDGLLERLEHMESALRERKAG